MNLEPLKYFLRVAALGSLTRAAAELDVTQPVISRGLAQLEKDFGGRLFHRTGHGARLTGLGENLLVRVKGVVQDIEALVADARAFADAPAGEVRVGMLPSFSTAVVSSLLRQAGAALPDVKVKIFVGSMGRLDEWLEAGRIDVSLNFGGGAPLGDAQMLGSCDVYLVGKKGTFLDQRETIDFAELNGLPLILPATRSALRKNINDLAEELGIKLNPVIEVDTSKLYLKLVREGLGYTITTLHALLPEAAGDFTAVPIVKPRVRRTIMLGTSMRFAPSLATRRLTGMIAGIAKDALLT